MSTAEQIKKKPAAKRYLYDCTAKCSIGEQTLEVQLLNISVSGIQFASRIKIEASTSIQLQWTDPRFGEFAPTLVIKREVYKPENTEFQYYYGSQYYNLDDITRRSLISLLKNRSQEEKNALKRQVEKISPTYLFQIIDEGRGFLTRVLRTKENIPHFENILNLIVDYEKEAFTVSDEISRYIQKLTTHHFHCHLLSMLSPIVAEHSEWKLPFFQRVNAEIQKMSATESDVDIVIRKLLEQTGDVEDDYNKKIQLRINESSNRLFYEKQEMLRCVMETFPNIENEGQEIQNQFVLIKETHDRIRGVISNTSQTPLLPQVTYERRVVDSPKIADAVADILTGTLPSGKTVKVHLGYYIALLLAAFAFVILTLVHIFGGESNTAIQSEMGLTQIQPIANRKFDQQINLTFRKKDWQKLSDDQKHRVIGEALAFLKKDPKANYCVMYDNDGKVLEILYEGMPH